MSSNSKNKEMNFNEFVLYIYDFLIKILKGWIIFIPLIILFVILGYALYHYTAPKYIAETKFIVNESSENSVSPLEQIGLATSQAEGLFEGDNLIWLYSSKSMIEEVLLSNVARNGDSITMLYWMTEITPKLQKNMGDLKVTKASIKKAPIEVDKKIQAIINNAFNYINKDVLQVARVAKTDRVTYVSTITNDEQFSLIFNDILVNIVNKYYIDTKTKKEKEQVEVLTKKVKDLEAKTYTKIVQTAKELDYIPYPNPMIKVSRSQAEKSRIEEQIQSNQYVEMNNRLEAAKIQLAQVTPLIQIIEYPTLPLKVKRPNKYIYMISGAILAIFIFICILIIKDIRKLIKKRKAATTISV